MNRIIKKNMEMSIMLKTGYIKVGERKNKGKYEITNKHADNNQESRMIRQLIGSSNVYRHYNHADFSEYPKYKMVNCTSKEVFAAALDNIENDKGEIIISVIENLLCDAVKDITDPEAMNNTLEEVIKDYLTRVQEAAKKHPNVKFAMAQPTLRPLHQWFTDSHEAFCKKIGEGIAGMDLQNVSKVDTPIRMSQVFETDAVHLTPTSGKCS